jgi:osmotically-inducible protein OsmY
MGSVERISVAVAALLLTHSAALYFRLGPIEQDLVTQVGDRLASRGLGEIVVYAEGRDIILGGWVRDRQQAAKALAIAGDTYGVRTVVDELQTDAR